MPKKNGFLCDGKQGAKTAFYATASKARHGCQLWRSLFVCAALAIQ
jgi:hypothetical protein